MLRNQAKPHRVTRLIVWLTSFAAVLGILHNANFAAQAFAIIFFARATYLLVMSFIYGVGGATKLDQVCIVIGILALITYIFTGSGLLTIILGIFADLIGFIPTFVKTFHHPSSEDPTFFTIEGFAALFGVIAVGSLQQGILFPVYIVFCNITVLALIYRKRFISKMVI
jgi:hypothetical protein